MNARDAGEEDCAAVALAACATKKQLDDLIEFLWAEDRGESRLFFVRSVVRVGGDRDMRCWRRCVMTRWLVRQRPRG